MNDTNTTWAASAVIAVALAVIIVGGMRSYTERLKVAFENGYEEGTVPGQNGIHWVKCKDRE